MANIIEYDAPTQLAPQPSDRASSAHAVAARRIDIAYNQAGAAYQHLGHEVGTTISELGHQYVDYQFHREVSRGGLAAAHVLSGLQDSWNSAVRAGGAENDPNLQAKFMEGQVEPALEKFREGFITDKGQQWADQHANSLRQHFYTTTTADISTIAGVAAHNNYVRAANTLSNMVAKDPSSLDVATASLRDQIDALVASSNMKGVAAEKFREDAAQHGMTSIVKAAAESAIRRNMPEEEFKKQFTEHSFYSQFINAGEIKQFEQQQRQMERFARADARYERQMQKQEQQEKGQDGVNRIIEGLRSDHPEQWNMPAIIRMKDNGELPGPWFEHAVRIFDRQTKEDTPSQVSHDNARALFNRIRLPVGDPNRLKDTEDIYAAYGNDDPDKQINRVDMDHLLRTFYDIRSPDGQRWNEARKNFLDAVKPIITKSEVEQPGGGQTLRFYEFENELDRQAEALGPRDRYKLIRPGNTEYMGTHDRINSYVLPMDVLMRNLAAQAAKGPPPPPKKPEETKPAQNRPPISSFGGK